MRAGLSAVVIMVVAACSGSRVAADGAPEGIAGKWRATDGNLHAELALTQHGDTVTGRGTYTVDNPAQLGCGGETITKNGEVTLVGTWSKQQFAGRLQFVGADWTPPFTATMSSPDTLRGGLMSIDRGQCPLTLVRER